MMILKRLGKVFGVVLLTFIILVFAWSDSPRDAFFKFAGVFVKDVGKDCPRVLSPLHIHMPGTMIGDVAPFDSVQSCLPCHEQIYNEWQGSMHGQHARDPMHIALRAAVVKYDILRGDWCLRCHEPVAWLEGRAQPNGEEFIRKDYFETNCDFCHRMVDAVNPDTTALVCPQYGAARDYGNAQYAVQTHSYVKRGPRGDTTSAHGVLQDSFQRKSEFCGVCHDASNPFAQDPMVGRVWDPPHTYGPAQRTYSEWLLSWYATQGERGTCQACHMPRIAGFSSTETFRIDLAQHDLTGGNIFIPTILPLFSEFAEDIDTVALRAGNERSLALLKTSAEVVVSAGRQGDSVVALVRVINLTGHKLPTGVSSRRMWINLKGLNSRGDTIFESGKYDFQNARIISDPQLKLYVFRPGMTARVAAEFGLQPGPSGLAGINDTIYYDNRIPPRGYEYAKFKERMAEPVGYHYADGQYWDDTRYVLPQDVTAIKVTLYYLTVTRATIEWLRDENRGNEFDRFNMGQRLYDAYFATGKAPPIAMNEVWADVVTSVPILEPVSDSPLPVKFNLSQNYPNPFNAVTTIEFWISSLADVSLELFDVQGKKVQTLVKGQLKGANRVVVDGSSITSGVYFYVLTVNQQRDVKKLILMK